MPSFYPTAWTFLSCSFLFPVWIVSPFYPISLNFLFRFFPHPCLNRAVFLSHFLDILVPSSAWLNHATFLSHFFDILLSFLSHPCLNRAAFLSHFLDIPVLFPLFPVCIEPSFYLISKFKFKFKNTLLSLQRNLPVVPQDNRKQHIL